MSLLDSFDVNSSDVTSSMVDGNVLVSVFFICKHDFLCLVLPPFDVKVLSHVSHGKFSWAGCEGCEGCEGGTTLSFVLYFLGP